MVANPILIERPLVVTDLGVRLARPLQNILEILPPEGPGTDDATAEPGP